VQGWSKNSPRQIQGLLLRPSDQDVCREFSAQNALKRPETGSYLAQGDIHDYSNLGWISVRMKNTHGALSVWKSIKDPG